MAAPNNKTALRKLTSFNEMEGNNFDEQLHSLSPLKKIRTSRGFTLSRLAEAAKVSASYLSRIESRTRRMNSEIIKRLCMVLKCTPGDLLEDIAIHDMTSMDTRLLEKNVPDLPLYSLVVKNNKVFIEPESKIEWLNRPIELKAEQTAFAVQIATSDNAPKYRKNDIVHVKPLKEPKLSMAVLIVEKNYEVVIGELTAIDKTRLNICSFNGSQATQHSRDDLNGMYAIVSTIERHVL